MCHQQSATVLINKVLTNVLVYYVLVSKVLKIYIWWWVCLYSMPTLYCMQKEIVFKTHLYKYKN